MHRFLPSRWMVAVVGLAMALMTASAQQHRATRLGDPAHRFAKPLQTKDDLRRLFADPKMKADIADILNQAGWKGDVEDLRLAAATAEIIAVKLPTGTRLPFMSSRNGGKPVALMDVLWAGKRPIDAYEFEFVSKGWRYLCLTPKACANFLVVDLGPLKAMQLVRRVPASVSLCEPFEVVLEVRNVGGMALSQVVVDEVLPDCMRTVSGQASVSFEVGTLRPGEAKAFGYRAQALSAGPCAGRARVRSAEGVMAQAESGMKVEAPALELSCSGPAEVLLNRPMEVCVRVKNVGGAAEPRLTVSVPVPGVATVGGATDGSVTKDGAVSWEVVDLAPGAERTFCVTFVPREPGEVSLTASAVGQCAPPSSTQCTTRVKGIPAILLEVVDLEDPVEVGQSVTYEIRVTNQGSLMGTNLRWVATLAESQEFVSGSGPTAVEGAGRTATAAALATLDPKAEVAWRVVVKAVGGADARFKVEMTSDQFQRPVEEWEATSQY